MEELQASDAYFGALLLIALTINKKPLKSNVPFCTLQGQTVVISCALKDSFFSENFLAVFLLSLSAVLVEDVKT